MGSNRYRLTAQPAKLPQGEDVEEISRISCVKMLIGKTEKPPEAYYKTKNPFRPPATVDLISEQEISL